MQKFPVMSKVIFKGKDKRLASKYLPIGTKVKFSVAEGDGYDGEILELNMFPGEKFYIFETDQQEPAPEREPGEEG